MSAACPRLREVDRHFARQLAPTEEHALREHLPTCVACTARYERHLRLAEVLPTEGGAEVRLAAGLGLSTPASARGPRVVAGGIGVLLAVAIAALFLRAGEVTQVQEPVARGGGAEPVALEVYALVSDRAPAPIDAACRSADELAFAYRNAAGKKYLLVFGVDAKGEVHWYHPAWTDPAQDPAAIPIEASDRVHELKEAIQHGAPVGPLRIEAWFTDARLTVKAVESALRDGAVPAGIERIVRPIEVRP